MLFDFDEAKVVADDTGGWLCLKVKNLPMARQFVLKMQKRTYTADVKEFRKKRSLDANAYFWTLADKLAEAVNITKTEVYCNAIREIGGVSTVGCFQDEDVPELCRLWECKGLGWLTETTPSKITGCTNIVFYKGSSEYDTAQMAHLIDNVVQDCEAVGIDTATPEERARLLEAWGHE